MNDTLIREKLADILHALPSLLQAVVEGPDLCSSVCLLAILYFLANGMAAAQPAVVVPAIRIGIGATVTYIALVFWRSPPSQSFELLVAILRGLITGGLFCTGSCIVIPIIGFAWSHTFGGVFRWLRRMISGCQRWVRDVCRQQTALFNDFRRRERQQPITTEERERREREAALHRERTARAAAEQTERTRLEEQKRLTDHKRREDARLRVYLARLRRKTHCYTKKLANLAASILFYLLRKSAVNTC